MDINLESLIEKIKKEGVDQAQLDAKQIITEAQNKSKEIVKEAQAKARQIKEEAEKAAKKLQDSSRESLKQASRDLILMVKEKLIFSFEKILKKEIKDALSPEVMGEIIKKISDKWQPESGTKLEVLVSPEDKEKIEGYLTAKFQKEAGKKIEIKIADSLTSGFWLKKEGQDAHYDFSDESLAEALAVFLNPYLTKLMLEK